MSKVLFLVNHEVVIYNFRLEIVEKLLNDGHQVFISSPGGERIEKLKALGCIHEEISFNRHGKNLLKELALIKKYKKLMKKIEPDMVFTFTIKPNIYGSIAANALHIPCVANITGLGTAMENGGALQKITIFLYKKALKNIQRVFFQNTENEELFSKYKIAMGKHKLLPGSGVNLERFPVMEYPPIEGEGKNRKMKFAFISRIMKEKGIEEYLKAAQIIKKSYSNIEFHVCGFCEDRTRYSDMLNRYDKAGIVIYHGMIDDVASVMKEMHCIIHPTYYPEGISNILLEACSCARPIITTLRSGCREVIEDGINGYAVKERDYKDLADKIEKVILLSETELHKLGLNARKKVEKSFDRQIVVDAYKIELSGECHEIRY